MKRARDGPAARGAAHEGTAMRPPLIPHDTAPPPQMPDWFAHLRFGRIDRPQGQLAVISAKPVAPQTNDFGGP